LNHWIVLLRAKNHSEIDGEPKLFYLALNSFSQKWATPIRDWKATLNRFTIQFDECMPRVKLNRRLHKIRGTLEKISTI
jgi:hypothetical protein